MKRILIVEDEELPRQLYSEFLEKKGYDVETAENGQKALDCISDKRPDLILLDINMPELNGKEFLKIILADDVLKDIPVYVITGIANLKEIGESLNLGARGYIQKSDSLGEVLNKIEIALGTSIITTESNERSSGPKKLADRNLDT